MRDTIVEELVRVCWPCCSRSVHTDRQGKRVLGMTTVYVVQQPDTNHAEVASMNTEHNGLTEALQ